SAPIIAEIAKEQGILTVGIVTKPFAFEGKRKMTTAQQGISNLLKNVDSLIVIPNDRLKYVSDEKITLVNAFEIADNVLKQGVESISELINVPAFINLDFADVRAVMKDAGYAHMGVGRATGPDTASQAAHAAIQSPLLETSISGARGVIISITSSQDIGLEEVEEAATLITSSAHPDANIIWGAAFDPNLVDELKVTVVATGFDDKPEAELVTRKAEPVITATQPANTQVQPAAEAVQQTSQPAEDIKTEAKAFVEEQKSFEDTDYLDDVIRILRRNSGSNFGI
ncbi:MAG: cell division protein FtsZ, partial [Oscillospiraceae bacterium]|nr:cell division protein FtsZ [Oscillospiraceae bacterium]